MADDIYRSLMETYRTGSKRFWVLLDPDRESPQVLQQAAEVSVQCGADGLLVGSSYYGQDNFDESVLAVRRGCGEAVPVLLFPGDHRQVSPHADAVLFLSLLSGRNPQYLVEEQMLATPNIRKMGLETIPTAYLLIESGCVTSVQSVTRTEPIDREDTELIATYALTGVFLGKKVVYLEAGSGARQSVPAKAVELTRRTIDVPLIVGGGIRLPQTARDAAEAGADFVVVGNALEDARDRGRISELADAVHSTGRTAVHSR